MIGPGSDMVYLIGHSGHQSERPAVLIVRPNEQHLLLIAAFESRALPPLGEQVRILTYGETADPFSVLGDAVADWKNAGSRFAVSDTLWATHLLGLQRLFEDAAFTRASVYLRDLRMVKDAGEIEIMRSAALRTDRALERVLESPLADETEAAVAARVRGAMESEGLRDTWAIVASGPNAASPHHISGDRVLRAGDGVVLDFGGMLQGYQSDTTRTVFIKEADARARDVYETVQRAQEAASKSARAGIACQDVDRATRLVIRDAGFGDYFIHRTGHGIGLDVHEDPYIVEGNDLKLAPGMMHSIEPGIYIDGELGVRIEDIVVITPDGADPLNHFSHDLLLVS